MSNLETIVGRVTHVGKHTFDQHIHVYSSVEIDTANGRVDLQDATAANALDRAIAPGKDVALAVLRLDAGGKSKCSILGVFDRGEQRLFVNEEMYSLREHATNQFLLYCLLGIVVIPVGLIFLVVPGLAYVYLLWKLWKSAKQFPTADGIRAAVEALKPAAH
jgi:hypothetical protein